VLVGESRQFKASRTPLLGRGQCRVRLAEHLARQVVAGCLQHDPNADADRGIGDLDERARDGGDDPLGQQIYILGVCDLFKQDSEMIAIQPRHQVAGPYAFAQNLGDLDQDAVAGLTSELFDEARKPVQFQAADREGNAGPAAGQSGAAGQLIEEKPAIGQPGQWIIQRMKLDLGLNAAPLDIFGVEQPGAPDDRRGDDPDRGQRKKASSDGDAEEPQPVSAQRCQAKKPDEDQRGRQDAAQQMASRPLARRNGEKSLHGQGRASGRSRRLQVMPIAGVAGKQGGAQIIPAYDPIAGSWKIAE
jgi:hypothetical protein